jgi:subtilisin family serine protease
MLERKRMILVVAFLAMAATVVTAPATGEIELPSTGQRTISTTNTKIQHTPYRPSSGLTVQIDIPPVDDDYRRVEYVPDELIIMLKDVKAKGLSIGKDHKGYVKTNLPSLDKLHQKFGVSRMERIYEGYNKQTKRYLSITQKERRRRIGNIFRLKFARDSDVRSAVLEFGNDKNVEYAEPNYIIPTSLIPNDSNFDQQWALNNTGQTAGMVDADIDAPEAWDIETGDSQIIIAVIDTGVDWDHPDLAANIWINSDEIEGDGLDNDGNGYIDDYRGWDFVSVSSSSVYPGEDPGPRDNDPMDFHGHGTHVSGIIGAVTDNSRGMAGITWDCRIMAVRAGYKNTSGYGVLRHSDIAPAIMYAVDNGANIINMSFGGSVSSTIKNAIDYAYSGDVTSIAAAGNENYSYKTYPAAYDEVIAVSATGHNDSKASFSNYGSWIDVAAPGVNIYSTLFDDTYASWSGTSMAAPHACGVAALVLSKNSSFSNEQVRQVLRVSTDDLGDSGWDQYFGYGRINAYNALEMNEVCITIIESPALDENIKGTVDIIGTASGTIFDHYEVYYGQGIEPTSWTQIGSTTYSQVTGGLLESWNTTTIPDGQYTIKLIVVDLASNQFVDRKTVNLKNVTINLSRPLDMSVLRFGDTINFEGTINAESFQSYDIEWGEGSSPATWYSTGITLENGGLQEVTDGAIGSWDTSLLSTEGDYEFRIIVSYGTSLQGIQEYDINLDSTIQLGWPKTYYNIGSTLVVDLDGDGDLEIVAMGGVGSGVDTGTYAWHHDGTTVSGWPVPCVTDRFASFAAGDVDNDGQIEVVLGYAWNSNKVYLFENNGALVDNWPQTGQNSYPYVGTPVLSDVDKDGDLEIFTGGGKLFAWHHDGTAVSGWPKDMIGSSPAIADINGDGELEIVVTSMDKLCVFDRFGSVVPGWPVTLEDLTYFQPVIGDIDNNGSLEIVVAVTNAFKVYVFDNNGSVKSGWPVSYSSYPSGFSPVIGDINNDGCLEVFLASDSKVNGWDHNGNILANWPVYLPDAYWIRQNATPVLGDVDGDGNADMVIGAEIAGKNYEKIYAYDAAGNPLADWPKLLSYIWGYGIMSSGTLCDLDNDGNINVVISSNADVVLKTDVYVWNLPFSYDPAKVEWGMFGNDLWNTGAYGDHIPPITTANPAGGFYTSTVYVTLSSNESSTIYYTTDGSDPDIGSSTYVSPIELSTDTELKFLAIDDAGNKEGIKTEIYSIQVVQPCEGDFDGDGDVDGSDLAVFAADFGRTDCANPPPCEGDFDDDGDVDGSDLAVFAADFGRTDCP